MNTEQLSEYAPYEQNTYKWKALVTVAMGTMMATVDASITNIAFPILTETFHAELTTVMWVTVAYILVSTSSMLVLGKTSDLVGRKRIYSLGMAIFTVGLIACSLSQSIGQLIFFRTLQALGAAMCVSCGTAIVTEAFPVKELGRSMGFLGVAVSLGFIIGPVVGGFLLHWLDWRSIFYVRAPLSFMVLVLALILLKKDKKPAHKVALDLRGTFASSAGIFSLVFGMSQIRNVGPGSFIVLFLIGLGTLFAARRALYQAELIQKGIEPDATISLSISPAFHDVLLVSSCIGFAVVILSVFWGTGTSVTASPDMIKRGIEA